MRRILFDTSIYGYLESDPHTLEIIKIKYKKDFILYGCSTIRKELKNTPKEIVHEKHKVRIVLLNIYDSFIVKENHDLKYNKLVETLASDYFKEYRKNGGSLSNDALKNDLIIIATATIYKLDIIVSADKKSMLSEKAIRSYMEVNKIYGMRDPEFILYEKFKKQLFGGLSSG